MAFDLGSLELLTVPINDEIDRLPLLKKFVYLLTLWFACTYVSAKSPRMLSVGFRFAKYASARQ